MSPTGEKWEALTSRQRVLTRSPGFVWNASMDIESAGCRRGQSIVMTPWQARMSNHQEHDGMGVPLHGEAAWLEPQAGTHLRAPAEICTLESQA